MTTVQIFVATPPGPCARTSPCFADRVASYLGLQVRPPRAPHRRSPGESRRRPSFQATIARQARCRAQDRADDVPSSYVAALIASLRGRHGSPSSLLSASDVRPDLDTLDATVLPLRDAPPRNDVAGLSRSM